MILPKSCLFRALRQVLQNWDGIQQQDSSEIPGFADWQHRHLLGAPSCSDLAIPSIVIVPEDRHVILAVDRLPLSLAPFSAQFVPARGLTSLGGSLLFAKQTLRPRQGNS